MTYNLPTPAAGRLTDRPAADPFLSPAEQAVKERLGELPTADLIELQDAKVFRSISFRAALGRDLYYLLEARWPVMGTALNRAQELVRDVLADRGYPAPLDAEDAAAVLACREAAAWEVEAHDLAAESEGWYD